MYVKSGLLCQGEVQSDLTISLAAEAFTILPDLLKSEFRDWHKMIPFCFISRVHGKLHLEITMRVRSVSYLEKSLHEWSRRARRDRGNTWHQSGRAVPVMQNGQYIEDRIIECGLAHTRELDLKFLDRHMTIGKSPFYKVVDLRQDLVSGQITPEGTTGITHLAAHWTASGRRYYQYPLPVPGNRRLKRFNEFDVPAIPKISYKYAGKIISPVGVHHFESLHHQVIPYLNNTTILPLPHNYIY